MGDSSQKNFYEVMRALEAGQIHKRPKVESSDPVQEVNRTQEQPTALPATIATQEAVKAGLDAVVVETFAVRDEAPSTPRSMLLDPRLTVSPAAQDRSGTSSG